MLLVVALKNQKNEKQEKQEKPEKQKINENITNIYKKLKLYFIICIDLL